MEKKYQIFVSSTYEDLKEERKKVQDTILSMHHFPMGMEMFNAADEEQWEKIKKTIDNSDYYILIIANRYGSIIDKGADKGISFTEKEYRYAKSKKIPILAFIIDKSVPRVSEKLESNVESQSKLNKFTEKVKHEKLVVWWKTKDDLASKVSNALYTTIIDTERPGWIRTINYISENEYDKMAEKIMNLQKENELLRFKSYDMPLNCVESFDLRKMGSFISYNNKENNIITIENEFKEHENGHIIDFVNKDTKKLKSEFIMLAHIYPENQNWVKYYYNDYGLFFSVRGSQNIKYVKVEIKGKRTGLCVIFCKKFKIDENIKEYCIRIRDIDIRSLSDIKEICFTIFNDYYSDIGKCQFEVRDVWLKQYV